MFALLKTGVALQREKSKRPASIQCVEGEYMMADEYDALSADPSNYCMRSYLPRLLGALGPWQMLGPWTDIVELPFVGMALIPAGIPPVQQAFQPFLEAGHAVMDMPRN